MIPIFQKLRSFFLQKRVDRILRHRFKIDPKAPKICRWCGADIDALHLPYGVWVGDTTEYECLKCGDEYDAYFADQLASRTICGRHTYDPGICPECALSSQCDQLAHTITEEFRIKKEKERKALNKEVSEKSDKS